MSASPLTEEQFSAILDLEGHQPCPGVEIEFDVELRPALGGNPRQYATLYRPVARAAFPAPGLLVFHGGGFCTGNPNAGGAIAKTLALALGVVTVSASYRLGTADQPTSPAILDDATYAWEWIHAHANRLGIAPGRIAVSGESAGCLLSGHLAVHSPWITRNTAALARPAAFIAFWGPLDFVARWYDNGENPGAETNILGPGGYTARPSLYHQLSVLTHASAPLPPALFAYGRHDPVVHPRQAALGHSAWRQAGTHAETLILSGIGHATNGDTRPHRRQLLEKVIAFSAARWAGRD